jgi:hypothetical protein
MGTPEQQARLAEIAARIRQSHEAQAARHNATRAAN